MEKGGVRGGGGGGGEGGGEGERERGWGPAKFNKLIIGGYVWHWGGGRGGRVIATEAIPMKDTTIIRHSDNKKYSFDGCTYVCVHN